MEKINYEERELFKAAYRGEFYLLKKIFNKNSQKDFEGKYVPTFDLDLALYAAAKGGNKDFVRYFLDSGARKYKMGIIGAEEGFYPEIAEYIKKYQKTKEEIKLKGIPTYPIYVKSPRYKGLNP